LQDPNSLVQRSILDLINMCLPLSTNQITKGDKLQLIVVAIHVVLRRDMSLNRRIYSWFMGSGKPISNSSKSNSLNSAQSSISDRNQASIMTNQNENNKKENYFISHSKNLLISAIKMLLNNKKDSSILYLVNDDLTLSNSVSGHQTTSANSFNNLSTSTNTNTTLKIIKIVSNLVERQEIGQSIIDEILLDLLFYIYKEYTSLINLHNSSGGGSLNSSHGHKRAQSNLSSNSLVMSFANNNNNNINSNNNQSSQFAKEINDLKKATCNFLFQSFQLYFIWDFCAKKFDKACQQHVLNGNECTARTIAPAQLCELYEFLLDLLKNAVSLLVKFYSNSK
jgi:hypothetical protein